MAQQGHFNSRSQAKIHLMAGKPDIWHSKMQQSRSIQDTKVLDMHNFHVFIHDCSAWKEGSAARAAFLLCEGRRFAVELCSMVKLSRHGYPGCFVAAARSLNSTGLVRVWAPHDEA